jgi:phosphodiesterase/alkaline phosphatase D-like protein
MEKVPIVYTLDDHDAGGNNANGNDASTKEANIAFRAVFPHFPIPKTLGVWQSFRVGHILFIVTDSRSYLFTDNPESNDSNNQTYFGRDQFHWILDNLNEASVDKTIHGVIMYVSQPWKSEREFV